MFSKAARMFRAEGVVTGSAAIGFETGVADRQLIDPATGGIAQKQGVGLHPLSGLVGATALLSAGCVGRAVDRSGWSVGGKLLFSWDTLGSARPSLRRFGGPRPAERSQSCRPPRCAAWGPNKCRESPV